MTLFLETWQYFGTSQNRIEDKKSETNRVTWLNLNTKKAIPFIIETYPNGLCKPIQPRTSLLYGTLYVLMYFRQSLISKFVII